MLKQMASDEQLDALKNAVTNRLIAEIPSSLDPAYAYAEEALDIENALRSNLESLPPERFVNILRPVFQEDEWILIAVGAVLGALAGLAQAGLM